MVSKKEISAGELIQLLARYFPGLVFFKKEENIDTENLDIKIYLVLETGRWALNIGAMSRSKKEHFACLFPQKDPPWDEEEAIRKYGAPDVIRYFIDKENASFLTEFSKIKNRPEHFDEKYIPDIPQKFLKELNYMGKHVCKDEDWDFSNVVRHNPPGIYKAFCYYAHRYYSLLVFALDDATFNCKIPGNYEIDFLNEIAERKLKEHYPILIEKVPETDELTPKSKHLFMKKVVFLEVMQEALETVSEGSSIYTPTKPETFIEKFEDSIPALGRRLYQEKINFYGINPDPYTDSDKKKINALFARIVIDKDDAKSKEEYGRLMGLGKLREKIDFLYRKTGKPSIGKDYSPEELNTIHELYCYQLRDLSLDWKKSNNENNNEYDGHDWISEDDLMRKIDISAEDRLQFDSFFDDEFKNLFSNKKNWVSFKENFSHFHKEHRFDINSDGKFVMNDHSLEKLFDYFCFIENIPVDNPFWNDFLKMRQNVMYNINQYRKKKGADDG